MVSVTVAAATLIVFAPVPRVTVPLKITPLPATLPPKVKPPPVTLTALAMVRMVPSDMIVEPAVPPESCNVPVPTGPLVTTPETGLLLAPKMIEPELRFTPLVKVLPPNVTDVAAAVVFVESVKVVADVMDAIVAPAGTPVPVTTSPTESPSVPVATVTTLVLMVFVTVTAAVKGASTTDPLPVI